MTLDQWLQEATRGLSPESVQRVRDEIQQHCESSERPDADAVAALGDPKVARRAYRKVLLTEREAMLAPVLTRSRKPADALLGYAILALLFSLWWPGQYRASDILIRPAILYLIPINWFWPPNTLQRCRVYLYLMMARGLLVICLAWWYQGWVSAAVIGSFVVVVDYLFYGQRLMVFRKLEAGQSFSLLPGEPVLTHNEAIFLHTLRNGEPYQAISIGFIFVMLTAMAVWLPATVLPLAVSMAAIFLTRLLPINTPERGQWYRAAKWTLMVIASLLPVLYGARIPWFGAAFYAFIFVMLDLKRISLRRKLPAAEWPKDLYY